LIPPHFVQIQVDGVPGGSIGERLAAAAAESWAAFRQHGILDLPSDWRGTPRGTALAGQALAVPWVRHG